MLTKIIDTFRKQKIFELAKDSGKDWDGDFVSYKGTRYYVNISTDELKRCDNE